MDTSPQMTNLPKSVNPVLIWTSFHALLNKGNSVLAAALSCYFFQTINQLLFLQL